MASFSNAKLLVLLLIAYNALVCSSDSSNCADMCDFQSPQESTCACVFPIEALVLIKSMKTSPIQIVTKFTDGVANLLSLSLNQVQFRGLVDKNMTLWLVPLTGIQFSSQQAVKLLRTLNTTNEIPNVSNYSLARFEQLYPPPPPPPIPPPPPSPPPAIAPSPQESSKKDNTQILVIVLSTVSAVFVLLCIIACFLFYFMCLHRGKEDEDEYKDDDFYDSGGSDSMLKLKSGIVIPRPISTKHFMYEELHDASNGFDSSMILGEGGFGSVFKGTLKDTTIVAIKKLTAGGNQGVKEFMVEVDMLSRLHHRNLVKLIGYYAPLNDLGDSIHASQPMEQMLCYEYVSNGSLETWLHGPNNKKKLLSWEVRMKIAIGAARGLSYLHEDSQPCVIHRDFKASNILLERNFQAKVSDFGLAKNAPKDQAGYISTRVMGTFGYVDPEYAMTGHLLVKSDVYSYGVVLLELLTGRKPVDMTRTPGQENLVTWARPLLKLQNCYDHLADPLLDNVFPPEDFADVAKIAAACVSTDPSQRPTMGEVVQSLKLVQKEDEYLDSSSDVLVYSNPQSTLNSFTENASKELANGKSVESASSQQQKGSPTHASHTSSNLSNESGPLYRNQLPSIADDYLETSVMPFTPHMSGLQGEDLHEGR